MVILGGAGNYLKASDVVGGEKITFKDEGEWIESTRWKYPDGSPKVDFEIGIEIKGEQKKMRLNKTNRDVMINAYDSDTSAWIGVTATITKEKVMVAGEKKDCIVLIVAPDPNQPVPTQEDIPF